MAPGALAQVLRPLRQVFKDEDYPQLLISLAKANDAALYALNGCIMIQNVDFFPPMVDDPYWYGAVAAANAMSDVYAMGGEVVMALNIAEFPKDLPVDYLAEVIRGGADKVHEAGAVVAGGHTLTDRVPKYGLSVTGFVTRDDLFTKAGALPGDVLLLTKPLGTGAILTAEKRRFAKPAHTQAAVQQMAQLNRVASKCLRRAKPNVHAVTDITGFSLLGHACEMAEQSSAQLVFGLDQLPFYQGALEYAQQGIHCSATANNEAFFGQHVSFGPDMDPEITKLLFGSESSGGLLAAVTKDTVESVRQDMHAQGVESWIVGHVAEGSGCRVVATLT